MIRTVNTPEDLASFAGCAFVPTMGALHEGHLGLIRRAKECVGPTSGECGRPARTSSSARKIRAEGTTALPVVVSIFVNPTQFGPGEDFHRYPRDLEGDLRKAESAGADVAFVPDVETIYPPEGTIVVPALPNVATKPRLEDAHRPGHFAGVCQVVARLFDLVHPTLAIFGEKDWQQLKVIEAMVRQEGDRWRGLQIIAHPTVRDADGLAMSSRNVFLSVQERASALGISRAFDEAHHLEEHGWQARRIEESMRATLVRSHLQVGYAVVRDAETLLPVESNESPRRALIAARIGSTRLIDNMAL